MLQVFRKATEAEIAMKEHGTPLPGWAKAVAAPGRFSEQLTEELRRRMHVSPATVICKGSPVR